MDYPINGSSLNVFKLVDSANGLLTNWGNDPAQNYKNAIECIDKHLNAKRVIIVEWIMISI